MCSDQLSYTANLPLCLLAASATLGNCGHVFRIRSLVPSLASCPKDKYSALVPNLPLSKYWSPQPDLNRWPLPYQGSALPTELCGPSLVYSLSGIVTFRLCFRSRIPYTLPQQNLMFLPRCRIFCATCCSPAVHSGCVEKMVEAHGFEPW